MPAEASGKCNSHTGTSCIKHCCLYAAMPSADLKHKLYACTRSVAATLLRAHPPQLFVGDTNRTISETPMNQASSRSHCIFTLHLEARPAGGDTVRRSKLHLVDLAGSERVGKTGIDGTTLKEAKYINLSLHFLEQVGAWLGAPVGLGVAAWWGSGKR
jgi:hypothetical protein